MKDPEMLYMVCTDDAYELPLAVFDTAWELCRWLGLRQVASASHNLAASPNGEVKAKYKGRGRLKYFRMETKSGRTIIGRLQDWKRKDKR